MVGLDSGATTPLNAPAKDLLLAWTGVDGRPVAAGEVVLRFDPTLIRPQLDDRRRTSAIAQLEHERQLASRRAELANLLTERRRLRATLVAVRAAIAVATAQDADQLDLLRSDLGAARLAAEVAEREASRVADEHAQGQAALAAREGAEAAARAAREAVRRPALALDLAEHPPVVPLDLAALRLRAEELAVQLGLGSDGEEDARLGIGARIAGAEAQQAADLASRRTELERSAADLHDSERGVRDRTPLVRVTVVGNAGPPQHFRFQPATQRVDDGWTADHGAAFDGRRGWSRPLTADELVWRQPAAAATGPVSDAPRAGRGGSGRRRSATAAPAGTFAGGLALVTSPARWSLAVPDGIYTVTVGLGDDREWDGPALRIEGVALPLPARLPPGTAEHVVTVDVRDGRLDFDLGDNEEKALRSPAAGVMVLQPHAQPGYRVQDPSRTLAFLAGPDAIRIDALVTQDVAPLLAPGRVAGGETLADRITLANAAFRRRDGTDISAEVVSVGAQSVRLSRADRDWSIGNPADNIAREVRLRPTGAATLAQGATIDVIFRFTLPNDAVALPPHLVRIDRDGAVVRRRGAAADIPVEAVRLGRATVVSPTFSAAELEPPPPRRGGPIEDEPGRFRGEVVPGARTRVSLHWIWGRVESLIADGSLVEPGDELLTIYNPRMDEDRERYERERRAAVQRVLAAAERRRQDLVRTQGEHAVRLVAERTARLRLRRHLDDDPTGRLDLDLQRNQTDEALAAAGLRLSRLTGLTSPEASAVAEAEAAFARARLNHDRAALAAAAWHLRHDWIEARLLAERWQDAAAALARRETELAESAVQERINTLNDRLAMERATEGNWWQRHFAANRRLLAAVPGRILWQTGWNDQSQRSEKVGLEFPVWAGMTVAEIVDERELRFTVELPDDRFPGLTPGAACELSFEVEPGRAVPARVAELGRAFTIPLDRLRGDDGQQTVSSRRAFTAIVAFTPPDDLRRRLSTGTKGWLRLP